MKLFELFESLIVYRGTKIPEKTLGDSAKMKSIFASTKQEVAKRYGEHIQSYISKPDAKILDYDVGERGSTAEKFLRNFLVGSGSMTGEKFDRDPRMTMAMQFMIPTDEFVIAVRKAGYDAVHMHADNTESDELMIINPSKFKQVD